MVLFCFEYIFWAVTIGLWFRVYHPGYLDKIHWYSTYCSGFKIEEKKSDYFHESKNQFRIFRMPLHMLCLCTRILHLLWSPPQVRFKALLGASTCSSTSSTRFRSWDILSPFIVKAIESHINLGQQHLTVKVKSVIKDKKSQGKYWRSLLSFCQCLALKAITYRATWLNFLLFDKIHWNHQTLWSHSGQLQHFCKSSFYEQKNVCVQNWLFCVAREAHNFFANIEVSMNTLSL